MSDSLKIPGDVLEGQGQLLQHGRFVAPVDYHLTIPSQTYFFINPTGEFSLNYDKYRGGFILLKPENADTLALETYTLELADKYKMKILVERRYKKVNHNGNSRISFWIKVVS